MNPTSWVLAGLAILICLILLFYSALRHGRKLWRQRPGSQPDSRAARPENTGGFLDARTVQNDPPDLTETDASRTCPPHSAAITEEMAIAEWESEGGACAPSADLPADLDEDDEDPAAGLDFGIPFHLDTPDNQIRRMWIDIGGEGEF